MVYHNPVTAFIEALQEIAEQHCGMVLPTEICLTIMFRHSGMQHPFNAVMQDTEFQYTLRSLSCPANYGCVCGYREPRIITKSSPLWLNSHDSWRPTRITSHHSSRSTDYVHFGRHYQSKHKRRTNRRGQTWFNEDLCGVATLWYNYNANRDDPPRRPIPVTRRLEFSLADYLKHATIDRLEEDVAMFIGDPLLENATPQEWEWLTSAHERGTRNTGYTEPTREERRELVRKFLKMEPEPLPDVPDVAGILGRIKTRSAAAAPAPPPSAESGSSF